MLKKIVFFCGLHAKNWHSFRTFFSETFLLSMSLEVGLEATSMLARFL